MEKENINQESFENEENSTKTKKIILDLNKYKQFSNGNEDKSDENQTKNNNLINYERIEYNYKKEEIKIEEKGNSNQSNNNSNFSIHPNDDKNENLILNENKKTLTENISIDKNNQNNSNIINDRIIHRIKTIFNKQLIKTIPKMI